MRTVIAVMLCSSLAFGEETPSDIPLDDDHRGLSMLVKPGYIVPFKGVCLDDQEHIRRERINERNAAELAKAKESALISKPVLVALLVGALVTGAAVSAGVVYAATRQP